MIKKISLRKLLNKSQLYLIIDKKILGQRAITDIARRIKSSTIDMVQLRDKISTKADILKSAFSLKRVLSNTDKILIINDYLDVAKIIGADGVHLGQNDIPVKIARKLLGRKKIIGISCHNLKQALQAEKQGADYIGIGPIYPTPLKPNITKTINPGLIKTLKRKVKIPFFAIGGIGLKNIKEVSASGISRVALCRGILNAKNIIKTTKAISSQLSAIS
ncbi:MAG: thiamine phosphate synthase [Candidatus Omnitrophica bacterium]|nr:thiamine phosphate synthase [Candidatus Omnitrophota bacterium]